MAAWWEPSAESLCNLFFFPPLFLFALIFVKFDLVMKRMVSSMFIPLWNIFAVWGKLDGDYNGHYWILPIFTLEKTFFNMFPICFLRFRLLNWRKMLVILMIFAPYDAFVSFYTGGKITFLFCLLYVLCSSFVFFAWHFSLAVVGCEPHHQLTSVSGAVDWSWKAGGSLGGKLRPGLPLSHRRWRAPQTGQLDF